MRLAKMIARPDVDNHQQARNKIEPRVCRAVVAFSENGAQLRAAKPCRGIDRDEKENQSSLAKKSRARQKKCARRWIHEIVLPSTEEIDLVTGEHMSAGRVPEFVIKNGAPTEAMQERKHGKDCGCHDEKPHEYARPSRRPFRSLVQG